MRTKMMNTNVHSDYNKTSYQTNTSFYQSSTNNYQSKIQFQRKVNSVVNALDLAEMTEDNREPETNGSISPVVPENFSKGNIEKSSEDACIRRQLSFIGCDLKLDNEQYLGQNSFKTNPQFPEKNYKIKYSDIGLANRIQNYEKFQGSSTKFSENTWNENGTVDKLNEILPMIESIKSYSDSGNIETAVNTCKEVLVCIEAAILNENVGYIKPLYSKKLQSIIANNRNNPTDVILTTIELVQRRLILFQQHFYDSKFKGQLKTLADNLRNLTLALGFCVCEKKNTYENLRQMSKEIEQSINKLGIKGSMEKDGLTSTMLLQYGCFCYNSNDYQKSLELLQKVVVETETSRSANSEELGHPENRFLSLCFAGLSLCHLRRFSEAKPYIEESLSLSKIVLENKNLLEGSVEEIKEKCQKALKIIHEESSQDEDKQ